MVTGWSRSTSHSYLRYGQNLTGEHEFTRKIYAACGNLFTDSLLKLTEFWVIWSHYVLSVFLHWIYKWNTSAIKNFLLFMAGMFIRFKFLLKKCFVWEKNNQKYKLLFVIYLAGCVSRIKSLLKRFLPFLMAFRSCISTGKLKEIWCFFVSFFFRVSWSFM